MTPLDLRLLLPFKILPGFPVNPQAFLFQFLFGGFLALPATGVEPPVVDLAVALRSGVAAHAFFLHLRMYSRWYSLIFSLLRFLHLRR
jgi:hypothetical protein